MRLLIDRAGVARFTQISATRHVDDRHYYIARDALAMVVCRNGLKLGQHLVGQVIDARIGWDNGTRGFVLECDEGKRHSKATLYRGVNGKADLTLSEFLARAPRP